MAGMILPSVAVTTNLIIMVNFFKALPDEILESVRIDGGGELTIFWKIVLPLSKPIIATVCIFAFVASWKHYIWPLLCAMSENMFTLPVGYPHIFRNVYRGLCNTDDGLYGSVPAHDHYVHHL